jgi:hypothetical protein
MSGPPEKENPRFAAEGSDEDFPSLYTTPPTGMQGRARCEDQWIWKWLVHLEVLNAQFGDGSMCSHIVHAATRAYYEFCSSCDPSHRIAAWEAIQSACRLFSRRSRLN